MPGPRACRAGGGAYLPGVAMVDRRETETKPEPKVRRTKRRDQAAYRGVEHFMTAEPLTIGSGEPMAAAHAVMRKHNVRHLPVLEDGRLVGVVSAGDLHLIETLKDVDPEEVLVSEAMTPSPFAVPPETPVGEVVAEMGGRKLGSTVVVKGRDVVGIFTLVDACKAFTEVLAEQRRRR